jgi:hypothetical protein
MSFWTKWSFVKSIPGNNLMNRFLAELQAQIYISTYKCKMSFFCYLK